MWQKTNELNYQGWMAGMKQKIVWGMVRAAPFSVVPEVAHRLAQPICCNLVSIKLRRSRSRRFSSSNKSCFWLLADR